jgi:GMP synthase (glutamine-hydrolysing)
MRQLVEARTPTFASCWGFQAMSLALGGSVEHLPERGHVGTCTMTTTPSAANDPLFATFGTTFAAQLGHEDVVVAAPAAATVLVTSDHGDCMAWRLGTADIWGTQFHPELSDQDLLLRLRRYPKYVREISGLSMEDFEATRMAPAPDADHLLHAFASQLA